MGLSFAEDRTGGRAAVVNENEVRAAAGVTMVIGAVAFGYAYFAKQYVPLQVAASLFFVEFLVRVTVGLRYSPVGVLARAMTLGRAPEWVSAKPKRFAWTLGLVMALAMTVITNSGIRGPLPRTMCLICLTLMWMESALGLCLGCRIYGLLLRRGWIGADPHIEVCADGSCERSSELTNDTATRVSASASGVMSAALAVGVLLLFASSSAASPLAANGVHQLGTTAKLWEVGVIRQGVGGVPVDGEFLTDHQVDNLVDLGPAAFRLPTSQRAGRATGVVRTEGDSGQSTVQVEAPTLDPRQPDAVKGSYALLDEYRDYRKGVSPQKQSVQIKFHQLLLDMIDANGALTPSECPVVGTARCSSIRTEVTVEVVAYKPGAHHPFFDVGGTIYAEGHQHAWFVGAGTSPASMRPFWDGAEFDVNRDVDGTGSQKHLTVDDGFHPFTITIPLDSVRFQHAFRVQVHLEATTVDDRGLESAAAARIIDPQRVVPSGSATRMIQPVTPMIQRVSSRIQRVPAKLKAPPASPRPAARCPSGPSRNAGRLQLGSQPVTVGEASGTALVMVTRTGGSRGATSAVLSTSGGSARSGRDFTATRTLVRFENGDNSPRIVEVPIREDRAVESPETFRVSLSDPRCARLGQRRTATAMILDDDQPPPAPQPAFTIGGTVDGLQGSGLVLSDLSGELPVSSNGSFTFPGTDSDGQPYEVNVATQPQNPDQVCTVQNGAGHVASANITNIAVHCALLATPSALDTTFGSGGRVSTPVGVIGQGEAIVIQPNGGIVTAGSRQIGSASDFALTRHNSDGSLDTSFGTNGIAVTDFGGADDKAYDEALLPDGGIVAVGVADPAGFLKGDFGIARYNPDGTLNTSFGTGGIVTTDIRGDADQAEAVAVQPDGKIVVAGLTATVAGRITDFALARYNPDGTLDQSFGSHGIVTTDISGDDAAVDLGIQADGKITLVGTAGEQIALARYTPNGSLDLSFGTNGTAIYPGFGEARGLAVTPNGDIFIAGDSGGDFLLLSYRSDGTLNPGFGSAGTVTTDISGSGDFAENVAIDAQGRIILVGRATSSTILDMALARYNPDGSLDPSFANHGILTADFHGEGDFGQDVALDSAGRIVAAGYTANGSNTEFALLRANP